MVYVKKLSISSKRQITIPKSFFSQLDFGDEAECYIKDHTLIIKPIDSQNIGEFDEEILRDLVKEGFNGEQLLSEFKKRRKKLRSAVKHMIDLSDDAAKGKGELYTVDEVFKENNN